MDNNWSIETIRETAASNWSLEGDNQLLNLMKSISKNLEQRCMTSNSNLNRLMLDVDKAKIKLNNATTKLLDLNNGKFVEHTVMDMDSSLSNAEKCTPADMGRAFVSLPKSVEQAVTNGLNMMDHCYEKVLLNLEDSDDEDENDNGQKHVVCRPKNPYLNRALPHLIGSKQWNDKWHVGLIESDEEVLSDEEPDPPEFSQSSSDEGDSLSNSPRTSNAPTTSESDFAAPAPAVIHHEDLFYRLANDAEKESPLFPPEDNKHRERIKVLPTIKSTIQNDAEIDHPVNKTKQLTEPPVPTFEQPKQSIFVQQKTEPKFLNLFDDEPPSLEEPVRHERKPVNLFMDSDDDDDGKRPTTDTRKPSSIFNNNVASRPTLPFSVPQLYNVPQVDKTKSAFHGDFDNNNVPAVEKSSEIKPTVKSNDFGGLFDDEPPDDFFDIIVRQQGNKNVDNISQGKTKLQSKTVNLFDSDDDDDDFSKIIGTTKKTESAVPAAVSSNKGSPVVKQSDVSYSPYNSPFKKNNDPPKSYVSFLDDEVPIVGDEKDDDHQTTTTSHPPSSRSSLFDDIPPDDLLVPPITTKQKSPTKIIYDDIATTLQEQSSATGNISTEGLIKESPVEDVIVEARPAVLPRKPELKSNHDNVEPGDAKVVVRPVVLPRKPELKPNHDNVEPGDAKVVVRPVVLPRKPELKEVHHTVVDKLKATDVTPVLKTEPKSDGGTRDETDQSSLSFRKNMLKFSNPVATTLPNVDKESKPKPNKLKTNFNINVAALLPGAKLPSQKPSAIEKPDRTVESDPEPEKIENAGKDNVNSISSVRVQPVGSSEDASGRLTCLSKNRPRIPVQRKPSTRTGRQTLYNKTLSSENENIVSPVETTDSGTTEIKTVEPEMEAVTVDVEKLDVEDNDWLSEGLTSDKPPPLGSNNSISNVLAGDDEEDWLKNIDEIPPSPSKTNLYDEDWLSTKEVDDEQKPSTQNMSHVMNYDWLTASSLPPDDISPPSHYSIDDDHEQDDWLTSYVSKERSSTVADLPNDDWLMAAETQETARETVSIDAKREDEVVEKDWLVAATLEQGKNITEISNDADDDWLTDSLVPPKAADQVPVSDTMNKIPNNPHADRSDTVASSAKTSQTHKSRQLFDSDDENTPADELTRSKLDVGRESSNIIESKTKAKNFLSTTIFDDDEDDVAAVPSYVSKEFAPDVSKPNPPKMDSVGDRSDTIKSKTETKKSLNSTLFDDDDDNEDDDLFASIESKKKKKKSSAKQTPTEAVKTTKKNVSIKTTAKSLFSDDDNSDPDNLFGKTTTTTIKPIKATSLFDDDEEDDDEDIFAPKAQKQQRVTQTDTKKKPSITKSVTTIPASSDPLADLLK